MKLRTLLLVTLPVLSARVVTGSAARADEPKPHDAHVRVTATACGLDDVSVPFERRPRLRRSDSSPEK